MMFTDYNEALREAQHLSRFGWPRYGVAYYLQSNGYTFRWLYGPIALP